ncbi:MAG: hypothetical protein PHR66_08775 [Desulfuromonadaceae bacterium]|nr:hypothetical protein [Desulfuromonadaceae bacterium]
MSGGLGIQSDGVITHAILVRSDDGGWDIKEADGLLPYYYERGERTLIGHSVGCCPACGESVIDLGDRFVCSSVQSSSGCNFLIRKEDIFEAVSSNIIKELHDAVIEDDSMIAEHMTNLLWHGKPLKTVWYGGMGCTEYEYYEMSLVKEEDGWTFKITRDDAELEAYAKEEYARMCSELY